MHYLNKRLHEQAMRRGKRFAAMRKKGWTISAIARQERISRQRVAEILKRTNGG